VLRRAVNARLRVLRLHKRGQFGGVLQALHKMKCRLPCFLVKDKDAPVLIPIK
jgi:hypothetical protein